MSAISAFLNQTCIWKQKTGADAFGQPETDAGTELPCRWTAKVSQVTTESGEIFPSTVSVLVEANVSAQDVLCYEGAEKKVVGFDEIRDVAGNLIGKWCYC